MLSSPTSRSARPFPALSPPLPRLPIPSNPALLRLPLPRDCRLPSTLLCSDLRFPEIASDALGPYPLCELSHRRILALGLTEHNAQWGKRMGPVEMHGERECVCKKDRGKEEIYRGGNVL